MHAATVTKPGAFASGSELYTVPRGGELLPLLLNSQLQQPESPAL